jgi:2'-5' RNA ligase
MLDMALSPTMEAALTHFQQNSNFKGFRRTTVEALVKRNLIQQSENGYTLSPSAPVAESIGNPRPYHVRWYDQYSTVPTYDIGQADYEFWDKASQGKAKGLELAGLFLKPLASKKAAWVLGIPPKFRTGHAYTDDELNKWWQQRHADILRGYEAAVKKADSFLIINSDMSVTVVPANVVREMVDEQDFSQVIGWRVSEVYPHPDNSADVMKITDAYTAQKRVRVKERGAVKQTKTYPNLLQRVPVIHIANNLGEDERYGHAEGEALIAALHRYGEVFDAGIVGNIHQGRPTPVIEKMGSAENVDAFWGRFGKRHTHTLPDGTTEVERYLEFSSGDLMTLGETAEFKYAQPGAFIGETEKILGLIYYLVIEHTEIPEFVWGNAIGASKASADAQLPPFTKWIEKEQGRVEKWVIETARVALSYLALVDSRIKVTDEIMTKWQPLTSKDNRLTLDAVKLGLEQQLLDDETALALMPLDIENPREVLDKLKKQLEEEAAEFERRQEALFAQRPDAGDERSEEETPADEDTETAEVEEIVSQALRVIQEQRTGVMVGFFLNGQGKRLYRLATRAGLENVTPAEDMHITLAFLGDMNDMGQDADYMVEVLTTFAEQQPPISGWIGGVGRFNTDQGDGTTPVYATFDSPDLPAFRQALVEALEAEGITISRDHGFIPHITLSYLDKEEALPNIDLPATELTFSKLILAWGDDRREIELKGEPVTA